MFLQKSKPDKTIKGKAPYKKFVEEIGTMKQTIRALKKSATRIKDDHEQSLIHESLSETIYDLRDLRGLVHANDDYQNFTDSVYDFGSTVSALTESVSDLLNDDGLMDCKEYVEVQIEGLRELLSVIETALEKGNGSVSAADKAKIKMKIDRE